MLFNSYSFLLVFLPVTVLGFFLAGRLGKASGAGWLAACSLFFYAWWDYRYLVLLVASICANYLVGGYIARHSASTKGRLESVDNQANQMKVAARATKEANRCASLS